MLSRMDGTALVLLGLVYTVAVVRMARLESRAVRIQFAREYIMPKAKARDRRKLFLDLAALLGGIVVIVVGAHWLVTGAVGLAQVWGVSDAFIGLTIVAIGTSSPELVTTVLSTLRNERDIAVGNLLGSSVYNIAFILGVTCLVPASGVAVSQELLRVDLPVMALVALICTPVFLSGRAVTRLEGGAFVVSYLAYLFYLIAART